MKSVVHKFQEDNNIPLSNTINSSFIKTRGRTYRISSPLYINL